MKLKFVAMSLTYLLLAIVPKAFSQTAENYAKDWQQVQQHDEKGLPKSALKVVEEIYKKAKTAGNQDQLMKSLIYKLRYKNAIEENGFAARITDVESEIKTMPQPAKSLLHSMLAQMYWMYYSSNSWTILDRTTTENFEEKNIEKWDVNMFIHKTMSEMKLSLSEKELLQKTKLENVFAEMINKGTQPANLRPTFYDFLAAEAISFLTTNENPRDFYQFTDKEQFSEAYVFAKKVAETENEMKTDDVSFNLFALNVFQNWLSFRLANENDDALLDVDLQRLEFIYSKSVVDTKDSLYFTYLQKLEKKYSANAYGTEVSYRIAQFYRSQISSFSGNRYDNSNDTMPAIYKWHNKLAHEICKNIINKYPDSYTAKKCKVLLDEILRQSLDIKTEQIQVPNEKFAVQISYRNMSKVFMKIASISREELDGFNNKYWGNDLFEQINKTAKKVQQVEISLPDDGDFNSHTTEKLVDNLPIGSYVVMVANNADFSCKNNIVSYTLFNVSNLSYITNSDKEYVEYHVLNRKTGEPQKDVTVQILHLKYDYSSRKTIREKGETYKTDANGYVKAENIKHPTDTRQFYIEFTTANDYLATPSSYYPNSYNNTPDDSWTVHFFTDRAIYRPSQTVYFKGLVLYGNYEKHEIAVNKELTVKLYDPNSQKVAKLDVTTNEFGSFNGSFALPQGKLNGNFSLSTQYGSIDIQVEEYKRPKFEVTLLPFDGNYVLNDSVTVKGIVKSYAGSVISDADVKFTVKRSPKWRYYYWRRSSPKDIAHNTLKTNEKGEFTITFKAEPDLSEAKNMETSFDFSISVDVTDINGETQSTNSSITVGYTALQASITVKDFIDISSPTSTLEMALVTLNLNAESIDAQGVVTITKLKDNDKVYRKRFWDKPDKPLYSREEWYKEFSDNEFDFENDISRLPKLEQVYTTNFDTKESRKIAVNDVKNWKTGNYIVELNTKDAFGNPISTKKYFTVYNPTLKALPYSVIDWYVPVKTSGEPGTSAKFSIGSSRSVSVIYEVFTKDSLASKQIIKLSNEQRLIEIPILESYRGNFAVQFTFVSDNRVYTHIETVSVPYTNKQLDISFETFRNKLQPGEAEQWLLKIKPKVGEKALAEMVATLYDASLDDFAKLYWGFDIYNLYYQNNTWGTNNFSTKNGHICEIDFYNYSDYPSALDYPSLNWFGFSYYTDNYRYYSRRKNGCKSKMMKSDVTMSASPDYDIRSKSMAEDVVTGQMMDKSVGNNDGMLIVAQMEVESLENGKVVYSVPDFSAPPPPPSDLSKVKTRKNFNETAFFFPALQTDENGNVVVKFTIPEALTRWRMLGFAHTKDLKFGFTENSLQTQKDLMILSNPPRFFREGDEIEFAIKISNLTDKDLKGSSKIEFTDVITGKPISNIFVQRNQVQDFCLDAKGNTMISWRLKIPFGVQAIQYKVVAAADNFTDGEENILPVLTNRMLVTEAMPLPIRGKQTKTFEFTKLLNSNQSSTLKHEKLTLEFTSNPAWYAVQALPYLMEYPYECAEQVFSRYYANSLATFVANSSPKIKAVFETWKMTSQNENTGALVSNLEKNQELKSLLLEETPWVLQSQNETERKKRLGLLFDMNKMASELEQAIAKLKKMQLSSGGFPWFDGMPESRYITQHIVCGLGHLNRLGVKDIHDDQTVWEMTRKAIKYVDNEMLRDYNELKKLYKKKELLDNHLGYMDIHYLYTRSFFTDVEIPSACKEAFEYYKAQAAKYWLQQSKYMQGMIALSLQRYGNQKVPQEIIASLSEFAQHNDEMGMYWKDNEGGYYWYQAPIETQALMIELYDEVAKDNKSVDELKVWLLKQKQTQDWKTTKATSEAIYALLLKGTNWLSSDTLCEVSLGGKKWNEYENQKDVKTEAGTGYFKTSWNAQEIVPEMGKITVTKPDEGVSWGAVYWQYFENLDKITPHETPLKLAKKLFISRNTDKGEVIEPLSDSNALVVGDKIIVRIELQVDRDMEYVHLKDMRAAAFEPINVISSYKYQGGLGYYESTKDAATNFFIGYMPKGTYIFEYPLRVSQKGDFSNGITSIQCMYAPEFGSHSEGIRVRIEK